MTINNNGSIPMIQNGCLTCSVILPFPSVSMAAIAAAVSLKDSFCPLQCEQTEWTR